MCCYMIDKSLRHFSKFGCILHIYLPLAKTELTVETHWFICAYSLRHLNEFSKYGPYFFPRRFIRVIPEFFELEVVDPYNVDKEARDFVCHNHNDICRILMRNVIVRLAIDSSLNYINL